MRAQGDSSCSLLTVVCHHLVLVSQGVTSVTALHVPTVFPLLSVVDLSRSQPVTAAPTPSAFSFASTPLFPGLDVIPAWPDDTSLAVHSLDKAVLSVPCKFFDDVICGPDRAAMETGRGEGGT